ncbi:hypothetical protein [Streptomyces sp. ISL-11]|uniref:hypothetical protein n=1 Tax=Streptomyces sp. ISL-11 TaxID=2819174 RepID=UPI001BE8DD06|nr:hypothetical protein [Streptomyces sp. ISL-11]MBT2383714.1 hypothetical protein [Streptomyces sp. ISL-11]
MANPHQQNPEGSYDPAGSTQMFRAFVDEGTPRRAAAPAPAPSSGPRAGVIVGVVVAIAVIAAVAWLALG